ncbi:MAG: ATP-binding protein [Candidatus Cloacimonetes bacterium]|nr:ATP-binding protein [Candidatus Cloacimonadota bacterium]
MSPIKFKHHQLSINMNSKGKIIRILYFGILLLIVPGIIFAQQYNFKTYSVEDGLAQSQVFAICQDSKGYMWFGTNGGGVSKFDGKDFKNFTTQDGLSNNAIWSILEDQKGNLWFATERGVSKFDGKVFKNFTTKEGLSHNLVWSILEDREGNLWFGTEGGISKFDGKTFKNFTTKEGLINDMVWSILEDRKGNLWFGTLDGVSKYESETFTNYTTKEGLINNIIWSILEDQEGNLWFGTDDGVSKYDGNIFINFTTKEGLSNNIIWSIFEDQERNLWFATERGVSKFNGKTFTNFTSNEGLIDNTVWSILEDREGNIWFATDEGISKYAGETFTIFTTKNGLINNTVWSIFEDQERNLWFGTNNGISKYNGKTFTNFTTKEGLNNNMILFILEDSEGNLWFGTQGGVSKFDGKTFTNFTTKEGLIENYVSYILEDQKGNLWFGTDIGISKYDGKTFTNFTTKEGLVENMILCILEDREGNLWFGTDGGVSKYDGKTFTNFTTKEGLSNNAVLSILEDLEGNLWFGTESGGITKFNYPQIKGAVDSFEIFTTEDGLFDDGILLMIFDDAGNLWVGTNKGIDKFDVQEYNKTGKKVFKHYGKKEGFIGIECNQGAVYKDSKGNIWFGTIRGVMKYNPKKDKPNTVEPLTHITNLRLFFEDVPDLIGDLSTYTDSINKITSLPIGLKLPYNKNHLTFDFIGISLTIPEKVRFQHKLEGCDKDWSPAVNERYVTYSNLQPGEYTFKVKACNNDDVWNKEPTAYSFVITPPFWQTWWFRFTMLIIAGMIIYGFFLWKTAQIRHRAKVLEQKVNERTAQLRETQKMLVDTAHRAGMAEIASGILHNVGNVLNSVKVSSQILKERIKKSKVNGLEKALNLMEQHTDDLDKYITLDEKGKMLPTYLLKVGKALKDEQDSSLKEISDLHKGINYIEEIVAVQQNYAGVSGIIESVSLSKMMDDVLRMYQDSLSKHKIKVIKHYEESTPISIEKGKLIQVFVNLLKNAQESLIIKGNDNKIITINISEDKENKSQIVEIIDNGVGIAKENLKRIFSYGFTTKKGSKGFGLHTSSLAISELMGKILVDSDGEGMGAKFTVLVPTNR